MVCGPGDKGNRFIGGDAPFEIPSTTILPHGLMSSVTVPKAAAAAEGDGAEGSGVGATVGALGVTSTVFVSATGGTTAVGGNGAAAGAATGSVAGAAAAGVGSVFTSFTGAVVAVGVVAAGADARPANKRYPPAPTTAATARPIRANGSAFFFVG